MSKFAVIQLAGKQHLVSEGDVLVVNRLTEEAEKDFTSSDVLLVGDEKTQTVGAPVVEKAKVTLKVVSHQKGPKIKVGKFKAKSRYRKVYGHRQPQTTVEVVKITG